MLPLATPALAQEGAFAAVASWVHVDVATGYEMRGAPAVATGLPGWEVDRWGNVVRTIGAGAPHRVLACWLDAPADAASQITEDGYLLVHRIGRGSAHPLWDQQHEAKPVRILTRQGPVIGVVARTNGHFASQHRRTTTVTTQTSSGSTWEPRAPRRFERPGSTSWTRSSCSSRPGSSRVGRSPAPSRDAEPAVP